MSIDADLFAAAKERHDTAAVAVEEQVKLLRKMGGGEMGGTNAHTREVAILEMCIARERAADEMANTLLIQSTIEYLARETRLSADKLANQMDAFTVAADASTKQLAWWTKVLAWATIALAIFAIAQAVIALIGILKP